MKILFITGGKEVDYLNDCILHGFIDSGFDVIDSNYCWFLSKITKEQKLKLYGKGFTITDNFEDRSKIDRTNIENRIKNKEFDLVVFGSVWRCLDHLNTVIKCYDKSKIVFCDGEDHTHIRLELVKHGFYFKRELLTLPSKNLLPIQFAIPESKITKTFLNKERVLAQIIPGKKETYIYDDEEPYYNDYNKARFGLTMKKAGWDCLRHYEIIANHCLPCFENFEKLPQHIMTWWPKDLQFRANEIYKTKNFENYDNTLNEFFAYCKKRLTTKYLAQYILEKIKA